MRCVTPVVATVLLFVAEASAASSLKDSLNELKSADASNLEYVEARIASDLDEFEDALIEMVSEDEQQAERGDTETSRVWTPNQEAAVYLLAKLRSEKAVPILARKIHYAHSLTVVTDITLLGAHPAAGALIAIGHPSVPALLDNIGRSTDPLVRKLSTLALVQIEEVDAPRVLRRFLKYHRGTPSEPRIKEALELANELAKRFRRGPAYLEPIRRLIQFITDYSFVAPETPDGPGLACNVPRAAHRAQCLTSLRA
jgi:hypothetical protein